MKKGSCTPDAVTGTVKIEDLHLGLAAIDEHEQLATERILLQLVFDQTPINRHMTFSCPWVRCTTRPEFGHREPTSVTSQT